MTLGYSDLRRPEVLLGVCEELATFMNGSSMRRVSQALIELNFDQSGESLDESDRQWLDTGLESAEPKLCWWAEQLQTLSDEGVEVIACVDERFPVNLTLVHDGPPMLFVRGNLCNEKDRRAVAVVGTREASQAGIDLAQEIAAGLVERHYTVVSGLAKGIDAAAHAATLNAGGRTIAVFGTPIDKTYPAAHASLARRIAKTGACVSQFLPRVRTGPWSFPARNITCSGLSLATVVVEASATSGARLQAEAALAHGKRVFLVERLVTHQQWAKDMCDDSVNATEVSDPSQIVEELEADLAVTADFDLFEFA
ncbi:MAG: DNA-processing protein DprA [Acidimicrobiaceae bacterium]|nr:DNA-processing protein DprA [Acidimicrobiaceae bacterium]